MLLSLLLLLQHDYDYEHDYFQLFGFRLGFPLSGTHRPRGFTMHSSAHDPIAPQHPNTMSWQPVKGYAKAYLAEPIDPEDLLPLVDEIDIVQHQTSRHKMDGQAHYSMKVPIRCSG